MPLASVALLIHPLPYSLPLLSNRRNDRIALHGPRRFLHDRRSAAERIRFELSAMIDGFLMHLDRLCASLPAGYYETVTRVQVTPETLAACPLPLARALAIHDDSSRLAE
jgi:hypothetical protein